MRPVWTGERIQAPEKIDKVRAPAGLDIGAKTEQEIGFGIVAELVDPVQRAASVSHW
jgi:xanthine/CO dehydrogenase XdhC/CoxF family maturation factor